MLSPDLPASLGNRSGCPWFSDPYGVPRSPRVDWRAMNFVIALLVAASSAEDAKFEALAQRYVQELLDRDPEMATRLGEHRNDARLNDYSKEGVQKDLAAAKATLAELAKIDASKLSAEDSVDARILRNRLEGQVYSLETIREWEWNPTQYNPGNGIYLLIARDFAPPEQR